MSLLITKNRVPTPIAKLVARPRLLSRLDAVLQPGCQIALVSAPAGFGKTTLLTQWLHTIPDFFQVGWFSLDQNDNHLIRFFSYLVTALHDADPSIGDNFNAIVEAHPDLTMDELASYVINQAATSSQNILLIIDDTHLITMPEIHRAIELIIDHLPANLRIVLAGRVDPLLPLARLRARGQLVEVRSPDLRFNFDETSGFLSRFADFSPSDPSLIVSLNRSTEGWAAGLQMTVLALRAELQAGGGEANQVLDHLVDELSGSHRYIIDYLLEEVLNHETPEVREFLIRTCVLERFCPDLCAAVSAEPMTAAEARLMIGNLERANLFIIPLDGQGEWYRYHHLFADMLRKQLIHSHPDLEPELHRRASKWYEQHEMIDEAIAQAVQSGDTVLARSTVEKYALTFILRGQITTALRWLDSLPPELLSSSPRLCLDRAWALTFTSQTEAAGTFLERAEVLLEKQTGSTGSIKSEILGLRSFQKSIYSEFSEGLRLAKLALKNSQEENKFIQCSSRMFLAIALIRNGNFNEAMDEYRQIQSACKDESGLDGLALLEADFLQNVAMSLNMRNETKQAIDLLQETIQTFERTSTGNRKAATLSLYVGLGRIFYSANRLAEAEATIKTGLRFDSLSRSLAAIDGWVALWWVKIGQRDYPAARSIIDYLEASFQNCDDNVSRLVIIPGAFQDLFEDKIDSAVKRLEQLGFSDDVDSVLADASDIDLMSWRVNEFFIYARVLAAKGKHQLGLRVLDRMVQAAESIGMDLVLFRVWLTQAIIYSTNHQKDIAMEIMARLLEKTSQSVFGAMHIYLSTGEPAREILLECRKQGIQADYVQRLLNAFPAPAHPELIPDSPESLSEREIEVLRLMAEGLKNQEIADRLVVSLNTIRYHSKNIFGKLGVGNRTAAVARARELALLE